MFRKRIFGLSLLFFLSTSIQANEELEFIENCDLETGLSFNSEFLGASSPQFVDSGEEFSVKFYFKNTGDAIWRSAESECLGSKIYLTPSEPNFRYSEFYQEGLAGWADSYQIEMNELEILPGEIASFDFRAQSFSDAIAMREYFAIATDSGLILNGGQGFFDIVIGEPEISEENFALIRRVIDYSGNYADYDLSGDKVIHVDISDQWMQVKIGDQVIKEMPVSTGAFGTPTPLGTHTIIGKNEVRIAHASPHWIMPNFLMLNTNFNPDAPPETQLRGFVGYGFHALPSLGNAALRAEIQAYLNRGETVPTSLYETDTFWQESWSNIGSRVSHGCIRVTPDEADWLFDFVTEEDFGVIHVEVVP